MTNNDWDDSSPHNEVSLEVLHKKYSNPNMLKDVTAKEHQKFFAALEERIKERVTKTLSSEKTMLAAIVLKHEGHEVTSLYNQAKNNLIDAYKITEQLKPEEAQAKAEAYINALTKEIKDSPGLGGWRRKNEKSLSKFNVNQLVLDYGNIQKLGEDAFAIKYISFAKKSEKQVDNAVYAEKVMIALIILQQEGHEVTAFYNDVKKNLIHDFEMGGNIKPEDAQAKAEGFIKRVSDGLKSKTFAVSGAPITP